MYSTLQISFLRKAVTYFTIISLLIPTFAPAIEREDIRTSVGKNNCIYNRALSEIHDKISCQCKEEGEGFFPIKEHNAEQDGLDWLSLFTIEPDLLYHLLSYIDDKKLFELRIVSHFFHKTVAELLYQRILNYYNSPGSSSSKPQYYYSALLSRNFGLVDQLTSPSVWHRNPIQPLHKLTNYARNALSGQETCPVRIPSLPLYKMNISKEDEELNNLYENICRGNTRAYHQLIVKADKSYLAAGLLLRYLTTVGKSIMGTTLLLKDAQAQYLTPWMEDIKEAADNGHPYAQDILAVLYGEGLLIRSSWALALRYAKLAAAQSLPRGQEYLGHLVPGDFRQASQYHFLLAFENGSLYAGRKLALQLFSSSDPLHKELSRTILSYAAFCGERDSLALLAEQDKKDSSQELNDQYTNHLIKGNHVLGFYREGIRSFEAWKDHKQSRDDLWLLAEEAFYKFIHHFQIVNYSDFAAEGFNKLLLKKAYIKLGKLWLSKQNLDNPRKSFKPSKEIGLKHLAVKCEEILGNPLYLTGEKNRKTWIKFFLSLTQSIENNKHNKSAAKQRFYSRILSEIYLKLIKALNYKKNTSSSENRFPEVLQQIKNLLGSNLQQLKEEQVFTAPHQSFILVKDFHHYRNLILLCNSQAISKKEISFSKINYYANFNYLYNELYKEYGSHNSLEQITKLLFGLKSFALKYWDIFLFPPQLSSPKKIKKFIAENSKIYYFYLSILRKQDSFPTKTNLAIDEFARRLKKILIYTSIWNLDIEKLISSNSNSRKNMTVVLIKKILTTASKPFMDGLLKSYENAEKSKVALNSKIGINTKGLISKYIRNFADIIRCAHYAENSDRENAHKAGKQAILKGSFENFIVIIKAPWINIEFRKKFLEVFDKKFQQGIQNKSISLLTPESLSVVSNSYYHGSLVFPVDHEKARNWYTLAFRNNSRKAICNLVDIFWGSNCSDLIIKTGILQFYQDLIDKKLDSQHVAKLHQAQIFIELEKYGEAYAVLNDSLINEKIGDKRRTDYFWSIIESKREQYRFLEKKKALLAVIHSQEPLSKRARAAYDLACLYMWGGYDKQRSLYNTLRYFNLALSLGSTRSDFFLTVIRYHLPHLQWDNGTILYDSEKEWFVKSLKQQATTPSQTVQQTLDAPTFTIPGAREAKEIMTNFDHLCQNSQGHMGLIPALFYKYGIGGFTPSLGNCIEWLRKTAPYEPLAKVFLKKMYPVFQILGQKELSFLLKNRIYTESRPKLVIVGAGISGIMSALLVARLKNPDESPLFDIHLFEKEAQLFDGASKLISRLHLGGEYPKDEQTARQCLRAAVLIRQMLPTDLYLTSRKAIDFIVAEESQSTFDEQDHLTLEQLKTHYKTLLKDYKRYYDELKLLWGEQVDDKLFGPPQQFISKVSKKDLEAMGVGSYYAGGVHTPERGFQPVALGILLEHLLTQRPNITIHRASKIVHVEQLSEQGFRLEVISPTSAPSTVYTKYLINAAWEGVPYINSLVKRGCQERENDKVETSIHLRCLALVEPKKDCSAPEDRSLFGLVGKHGGMASFFNNRCISLFGPGDNLSYQGTYKLDESSSLTNDLPIEARKRYEELTKTEEKIIVAKRILGNSQRKYAFLEGAEVIDLITRPTLTRDAELHQRQHANVKWIGANKNCLEAFSSKGSFSVFVALQVVAHLLDLEEFTSARKHLSKEARTILKNIKDGINFNGNQLPFKSVILPKDFILIQSEADLPPAEEITQRARRYEFHRELPFTVSEENSKKIKGTMDSSEKFAAIDWGESIDLEHHILTRKLVKKLIGVLKEKNVKHLKIGRIEAKLKSLSRRKSKSSESEAEKSSDEESEEEINENTKGIQKAYVKILKAANLNTHLESLTLNGWDLSSLKDISALQKLILQLKSFALIKGTFPKIIAQGLSFKDSKLQKIALLKLIDSSEAISIIIKRLWHLRHLQELTIVHNDYDWEKVKEMILKQPSLERLTLRGTLSSLPPFSDSREEIDAQLNQSRELLLSITGAPNLKYVDLGGNESLNLVQANLDYYLTNKDKNTISPQDLAVSYYYSRYSARSFHFSAQAEIDPVAVVSSSHSTRNAHSSVEGEIDQVVAAPSIQSARSADSLAEGEVDYVVAAP